MAWNDPGRNRNPWGNRPDKGAADLDEALRNLQRKLSQMFGGNGGGGDDGGRDGGRGAGPGGNAALRGFGFGTVALVLLGVWALTGFYKVDAAERGIVTRFGQYVSTTEPGLRWHVPWPIEARQIINVETIEGVSDQTRMLTADENLVDINIAIQYRRAEPFAYAVPGARSRPDAAGSGRERHPRDRRPQPSRLRARRGAPADHGQDQGADPAHARQLQHRHRGDQRQPHRGAGAGAGAEFAARREQGARGQASGSSAEAQAYANDILPKAEGRARAPDRGCDRYRARVVADAEGEAARFTAAGRATRRAEVTRQRLILETIEHVLASRQQGHGRYQGRRQHAVPAARQDDGRPRRTLPPGQRQIPATVQPKATGSRRRARRHGRCGGARGSR